MELCFCFLILLFLLLFHFHISVRPIRIDPVQIRAPPVRNRTIPVLQSLENGNRASSFWNYEIPDPDQIGSGDGWSSTCTVENGWRWSRTAFPILNNQHIQMNTTKSKEMKVKKSSIIFEEQDISKFENINNIYDIKACSICFIRLQNQPRFY